MIQVIRELVVRMIQSLVFLLLGPEIGDAIGQAIGERIGGVLRLAVGVGAFLILCVLLFGISVVFRRMANKPQQRTGFTGH